MEILRFAFTEAAAVAALARQTEEDGWGGLLLSDSQCLQSDVYVSLTLAAQATRRLRLGPGVTNLATRHPSVTANALATLQELSAGRAVLGLGRGDTAVARLGWARTPLAEFECGVQTLQDYLRGQAAPDGSRLAWMAGGTASKVPLDVFASGPRAMAVGARHAERVTLAVGAEPAWVEWALGTVRQARREAGVDPEGVQCGLSVCMGLGDTPAEAREQVRGNAGLFAAFAGSARRVPGLLSAEDDRALAAAGDLPDAFLDRFAVVGTPERCVARLRELAALGLGHLVVVGPSKFAPAGSAERFAERMRREVLPALA